MVIKTLELERVNDWKGIELFEREAKTLEHLDHPSIPNFIGLIKDEIGGSQRWHLIQEKVSGLTISELVDSSPDEKQIQNIAKEILKSLCYLQSFSPPLLHRDIKPQNILCDGEKVFLVDFGSVRFVVPRSEGGSTIVGTSGYLAPEQLWGRADRSSDLYGLGRTLLFLMTGTEPESFEEMEDFPKLDNYSPEFVQFVKRLNAPIPEDRFPTAADALDYLDNPMSYMDKTASSSENTEVTLFEAGDFPMIGEILGFGILYIFFGLSFSIFWGMLFGWLFFKLIILWPFILIYFVILPPFVILYHFIQSTFSNLYFDFDSVRLERGWWIFKKEFDFSLSAFLEIEAGVGSGRLIVDEIPITGILKYDARVRMKNKLERIARKYDKGESETVFDFEERQEERIEAFIKQERP